MEKKNLLKKIEDSVAGTSFAMAGISNNEGGDLKKIYIDANIPDGWAKQQFPTAEIVRDVEALLTDEEIDLILIPQSQKENLTMVAEILHTGKSVRMV